MTQAPGMQRAARLAARLLDAPVARASVSDEEHRSSAEWTGRPLPATDPSAWLVVPLRSNEGRVVGSLCAIDDASREWTNDDAAALADLAALVGDELRLRGEVRRDDLTGLPNRRHWLEQAPVELARALRENRSASAVILDLDGFKAVNDERGHAAGDAVLATLGHRWGPLVRAPDLVARWGGDEFVLLLFDADAEEARQIADRLAAAAEPVIGLSCGVAEWDRRESLDALLARADRELLEAKRDAVRTAARRSPTPM
jgi:diguanylate cyclase (GGDEF)-like protein